MTLEYHRELITKPSFSPLTVRNQSLSTQVELSCYALRSVRSGSTNRLHIRNSTASEGSSRAATLCSTAMVRLIARVIDQRPDVAIIEFALKLRTMTRPYLW